MRLFSVNQMGILAALLTQVVGYLLLPVLSKHHLEARVREDGPKTHLSKSGTPLMGGLFMLIPVFALALIEQIWAWIRLGFVAGCQAMPRIWGVLLLVFCYALIGFVDDWTKTKKRREGLSVRQKTVSLGLIALLFSLWAVFGLRTSFVLPFVAEPFCYGAGLSVGGAMLWTLILTLFVFFMANSVNLTDGVDGLCSSLSGLVFYGLVFLSYLSPKSPETDVLAYAAPWMGVCLSFLVFNWHPAKVFMGDTGSLGLGAALSGISILSGRPWILLLMGVVFIAEGCSTLLQVAYFKSTHGKRLFRMAPLHHHFELGGMKEVPIVLSFLAVTLVAVSAAVLLTVFF